MTLLTPFSPQDISVTLIRILNPCMILAEYSRRHQSDYYLVRCEVPVVLTPDLFG